MGAWRRYARRLAFAFLVYVVAPIGTYLGTVVVSRLQLIQLDAGAQITVVVFVTFLAALSYCLRDNRSLRRRNAQLNARIDQMKRDKVYAFHECENVPKTLTQADPELVVHRSWPQGLEVRVEFTADRSVDFDIRVLARSVIREFRELRVVSHDVAAIWDKQRKVSTWSKDFLTFDAEYFFVARLPRGTKEAGVRIQVFESRPTAK